jgi:hypothetical protein
LRKERCPKFFLIHPLNQPTNCINYKK